MMANPLRAAMTDIEIVRPPISENERVRFWIERGNQLLMEQGRDDLHWACVNGHYFIEPRR